MSRLALKKSCTSSNAFLTTTTTTLPSTHNNKEDNNIVVVEAVILPHHPDFCWTNVIHLRNLIEELVKEVETKRDQRRKKVLENAILEGRDDVLSKLNDDETIPTNKTGNVFRRLPSNSCPPITKNILYCLPCENGISKKRKREETHVKDATSADGITFKNEEEMASMQKIKKKQLRKSIPNSTKCNNMKKRKKRIQLVDHVVNLTEYKKDDKENFVIKLKESKHKWVSHPQSILFLEGADRPRPLSNATVFLKTSYASEDNQNLTFVPYFGDDDKEDVVSELFNIKDRETMVDLGAGYQQTETYDTIDEILYTLLERYGENIDDCFCSGERQSKESTKNKLPSKAEKNTKNNNGKIQKNGKKMKKSQQSKSIQSLGNLIQSIQDIIGNILDVRDEYIIQRFNLAFPNGIDSSTRLKMVRLKKANGSMDYDHYLFNKQSFQSTTKSSHDHQPRNSSSKLVSSYEDVMDSYRNLFCRRCFTYDCNLHGNLPKPDITLQGEIASMKDKEGDWEASDFSSKLDQIMTSPSKKQNGQNGSGKLHHLESKANKIFENDACSNQIITTYPSDNIEKTKVDPNSTPLTPLQKSIIRRTFLIFKGDIQKIAQAIGSNLDAVSKYVKEKDIQIPKPIHVVPNTCVEVVSRKKRGRRSVDSYFSMKNYNSAWLRRVQEAEIHPSFLPCDHIEPCSDETCSCVRNAFFCTKHCVWGQKSRNFYRGCACKAGQCRTKSCSCFAAKRECDPDLCRACGACSDKPNAPATHQRCRNDNIGMRRHCHLLLAESSIEDAGWGVYTKNALKKGDFVHEYVGEVISQEEAERRGRIYDKVNRSYLFNLSSDYVVDASRKGNKTKFANHSSKPNCYTRMICVNGDIRIGLFAKEDIEAQSELFFDYRYDVSMDNDLIIKPGKTVDWMKNSKMANKISKKSAEQNDD